MKDTKRELPMFSFYNFTAIEQHLEKRAREGWRLIKAEKGGWLYRRMEPKELHYAVVYFPDASQFDPGPTEGQQTLRDYCLAAGWEPVTNWAQAQIYCNPQPDPVPIETEPSLQLKTVNRTMWRVFLPGELTLAVLLLWSLWMQGRDLYWDPADYLSTFSHLGTLLIELLGILMVLVDVGGYFLWYARSKHSIAHGGGCVPATGHYRLVWALVGLMGAALVIQLPALADGAIGVFTVLHMLGMLVMIWLTWKLQEHLKRKKFSRNANRVITIGAIVVMTVAMMGTLMAGLFMTLRSGAGERTSPESYEVYGRTRNVYHDDIPLRVEDLTEVDYDHWSTEAETQSSPLAAQATYTQRTRIIDRTDAPDLEYTVTDVRLPFLEDFIWKGCLRSQSRYDDERDPSFCRHYEPIVAAPWGADEAYRLYDGEGDPRDTWLVRWGSRMVEIEFFYADCITDVQAAVIAEKLAPR